MFRSTEDHLHCFIIIIIIIATLLSSLLLHCIIIIIIIIKLHYYSPFTVSQNLEFLIHMGIAIAIPNKVSESKLVPISAGETSQLRQCVFNFTVHTQTHSDICLFSEDCFHSVCLYRLEGGRGVVKQLRLRLSLRDPSWGFDFEFLKCINCRTLLKMCQIRRSLFFFQNTRQFLDSRALISLVIIMVEGSRHTVLQKPSFANNSATSSLREPSRVESCYCIYVHTATLYVRDM